MKALINVIRFILILLLTILIISLVFINIAKSTIMSKDYILGKLDETDYYINIKGEIESNFQNYIGQSGLDEEVLNDIVTDEKIKNDTKIILNNIYDGTSEEITTTEIEEKLRTNIENSLEEKLTATQQKMVDEYIKKICNQYLDTMSHTSYENSIYKVISKIDNYMEMAIKGLAIGIVAIGIILILTNIKQILKAIAHLGISAFASGIFMIIVNIYINLKIQVNNLFALNQAVSSSIRNIANDILGALQTQGIILLVVGLIMIVLGNVFYKNNKEQVKSKH